MSHYSTLSTAAAESSQSIENFHEMPTDHFWFETRWAFFARFLQILKLDLRGRRVLDVGCGSGVVLKKLERYFPGAHEGCDLNHKALSIAAKHVKGSLYFYDISDRRREFKQRFDAIILFDVLEHIEFPIEFLKASLFHLREGGFLFVNVPAVPSLYSDYDRVVGHYCRYDLKSLEWVSSQAGFKTVQIVHWGFLFLPIAWLRKLLFRGAAERVPDTFGLVGGLLNGVLGFIGKVESHFCGHIPIGTSIMAVFRK